MLEVGGVSTNGSRPTLSGRLRVRRGAGRDSDSFHGSPLQVSAEVLPDSLETPEHRELAVGKVFEEAIDYQARDFAPVAVTAERHFFEQYRTDGNQRGEGVAEQQEFQEE